MDAGPRRDRGVLRPPFRARDATIHRADATLALGAEFAVEEEVAIDAVDEWMELGSLPMHFEVHPWMRELLGPGRTLHFHATDVVPEAAAEWVVDLTGDVIDWRRAHENSAVAVRGPLTSLLLVVYRRLPVRSNGSRSPATRNCSTSGWNASASAD